MRANVDISMVKDSRRGGYYGIAVNDMGGG